MIEGQMSIWDLLNEEARPYKISNTIRLIELFAGVGSQAMALRDIGADFEHYRVVEFDKYAIASYNAIHGTDFPPMDVTKVTGEDLGIVDSESFTYLLTYSFPCTDLSVAGKMAGMEEGTLTTENIPSVLEKWIWEIDGIKYLIRIRKLTPKECWRLMDFTDADFEKAQAVNSNTQLYKQAGNSIVKSVLMAVFSNLMEENNE